MASLGKPRIPIKASDLKQAVLKKNKFLESKNKVLESTLKDKEKELKSLEKEYNSETKNLHYYQKTYSLKKRECKRLKAVFTLMRGF